MLNFKLTDLAQMTVQLSRDFSGAGGQYSNRAHKLEVNVWRNKKVFSLDVTRAHHTDEIPERDVTYHLTCLLIYH